VKIALPGQCRSLDLLLLLGYCGLVFWLSSRSTLPGPDLFSQQDKLVHAIAYALMAWLVWHVCAHWHAARSRMLLITVLFCMLYGLSDEWHQSFVPGRDASPWDWLADGFGALVMALWIDRRAARKPAADCHQE